MNSSSRTGLTLLVLLIVLSCSVLGLVGRGAAESPGPAIETKVLRVFITKKAPYYHKPWKSPDFTNIKASGFFFKDDKLIECKSEEEIFRVFAMDYIPPELRENIGELEAAKNKNIPKLVDLKDIKNKGSNRGLNRAY